MRMGIQRAWIVQNPNAFEAGTDSVYYFIIKTELGFLKTKGLLKHQVSHLLEILTQDMEHGFAIDHRHPPDFEEEIDDFNYERYPYLIITELDEIEVFRTMWELTT